MNTHGLSLDQAPPLLIPLRFFLSAPGYAAAAGLWLAWNGVDSRWEPGALAMTHLITLGFCTQIMLGAFLQLLPVLAGTPVPAVVPLGRAVHVLFNLGTLALVAGFLGVGPPGFAAGGLLLTLALGSFGVATGIALGRARGAWATVVALRLALVALVATLTLALALIGARGGWVPLPGLEQWIALHLGWALLGWVGLPLLGLLIELVPMFYVAPAYPIPWRRWPAPALAAALVIWTLSHGLYPPAADWALAIAVAILASFGVQTLIQTRRRLRPVWDITLFYVWVGAVAWVAAALSWFLGQDETLTGLLLLAGVCLALPSGMLYKIVPFLCWFHLQGRLLQAGRFHRPFPTMKTFLGERNARLQGGLYLAALGCILLGRYWRPWFVLGGVLLALAALGLAYNLVAALARYRRELAAMADLSRERLR